jgi:ABC-type transport system substrate-binding protein
MSSACRPVLVLLAIAWAVLTAQSAGLPDEPRRGGTLRLWFPNDFRTLDPAIAYEIDSVNVSKAIFRSLLEYDFEGRLVPDQASDWNVSPDGRTYTFHLRPGVRFTDGREVVAEDYVFTIERLLDAETASPGQPFYLGILGAQAFSQGKAPKVAGLRAPDRRTLEIELEHPSFVFRYAMAMNFSAVVPRERVERFGSEFHQRLAGSGGYQLTRWNRGSRMRLERNPHYSGPGAWVDAMDIMIGGDASLAAMMLSRGELDWVGVDATQAQVARRTERLRESLEAVPAVTTLYVFMNTDLKPFDDRRVRQAMNLAVDKQRLLKVGGGLGLVAEGIVPPNMPWSNPGRPKLDYDPARARQLLAEAGYPDGFTVTLWYEFQGIGQERYATALQEDLSKVGIRLNLMAATWPAMRAAIGTRGKAQCGLSYWAQDYPDPSNFLEVLFSSANIRDTETQTYAFYREPEVDRLLNEAAPLSDPEARRERFRAAENRILLDAPWIPLLHPQFPMLRNPRVRGFAPHPVWLWRFNDMWLNEGGR